MAELRNTANVLVETTPDISSVFCHFYQSLYSSKVSYQESLLDCVGPIQLPSLLSAACAALEAPLTLDELQTAAVSVPNNKSPGTDGLPGENYKAFGELLLPKMLGVFNAAFDVGKLPESMNEAIIIVLLKPDKDPVNLESYRPISLLTSDVKLLAKVLATRLIKHIDSLCSPRSSQAGLPPQIFGDYF